MSDFREFFPHTLDASASAEGQGPAPVDSKGRLAFDVSRHQMPSAEASRMDANPINKIAAALGGLDGVVSTEKPKSSEPLSVVVEAISEEENKVVRNVMPTLGSLLKRRDVLTGSEVATGLQEHVTNVESALTPAVRSLAAIEHHLQDATEAQPIPDEVVDKTNDLFTLSEVYAKGHAGMKDEYVEHGSEVRAFGNELEMTQQDAASGAQKIATIPDSFARTKKSPEGRLAYDHAAVLQEAVEIADTGRLAARKLSDRLMDGEALEGAPNPNDVTDYFQGLLHALRKVGDGTGSGLYAAQGQLESAKQTVAAIADLAQQLPGKHQRIVEDMSAVAAVANDLRAIPLFAER